MSKKQMNQPTPIERRSAAVFGSAVLGIVLLGVSSLLSMTWSVAADDQLPTHQAISIGPAAEYGLGQRLELVQWSHDSNQLYATGASHNLTFWKRTEAEWIATNLEPHHHANSIMASRKSPLIVLGTNVGTAEVWDVTTKRRLGEYRSSPNYSVYAVAMSPDEKWIAACGTDGTVDVFDRTSQQVVLVLGEKADTRMSSLAFSPDGKTLAAMDRHGHLVLWSLPEGERLAAWDPLAGERCTVQWSLDGKQLAVSGWGRVTLIEAKQGSQPCVVGAPEAVCPRSPRNESDDSRISVGGVEPGAIIFASVTAIAPDLRLIASVAPDASVAIWELATRRIVQKLPAPKNVAIMDSQSCGLRHLAFSPDGRRLACTTLRGDVVFWPLAASVPRKDQDVSKLDAVRDKALDRRVSVRFQRAPLNEVLETLCQAAGVKLEIDRVGLKSMGYTMNMRVTIDAENVALQEALTVVLKPFKGLSFNLDKNKIRVGIRKHE